MAGRSTPHITDRDVSTVVTLGSVGDPTQRVPFKFRDGVVDFVGRRLPRIHIKVGSSLSSLPEKGFHTRYAARN